MRNDIDKHVYDVRESEKGRRSFFLLLQSWIFFCHPLFHSFFFRLILFLSISQAFLQGGLGGDSGPRTPASQGGQILPQNLRIISNFFRTAPDGSVRAFSQPIVHER